MVEHCNPFNPSKGLKGCYIVKSCRPTIRGGSSSLHIAPNRSPSKIQYRVQRLPAQRANLYGHKETLKGHESIEQHPTVRRAVLTNFPRPRPARLRGIEKWRRRFYPPRFQLGRGRHSIANVTSIVTNGCREFLWSPQSHSDSAS